MTTPDRAAAPAPLARETGYYWVRLVGMWRPAHWTDNDRLWRSHGYSAMSDEALSEIGPRIPSPDEQVAVLTGREAGAGITHEQRMRVEQTTAVLANTPLRNTIWMQKWGDHINALMDAGFLPGHPRPQPAGEPE